MTTDRSGTILRGLLGTLVAVGLVAAVPASDASAQRVQRSNQGHLKHGQTRPTSRAARAEAARARYGARLRRDVRMLRRRGRDHSTAVANAYAKARDGQPVLPTGARKYDYVLVPGAYSGAYPGYMRPGRRHLAEHGLRVRYAPVSTFGEVQGNVPVLRQEIERSAREGRQVVLVGHSKGGVEIMAALALHPELRPHVRAVITMQSPVRGYAGEVREPAASLPPLARPLYELTYPVRARFDRENPYPHEIPTLQFATATDALPAPLRLTAPFPITDRVTDGYVPLRRQVSRGAQFAVLDGVNHTESVWATPPNRKVEQGPLLEALVATALTMPRVERGGVERGGATLGR